MNHSGDVGHFGVSAALVICHHGEACVAEWNGLFRDGVQFCSGRPYKMIVRGMLGHRRSITWVRPGLSGYHASSGVSIFPLPIDR